MKIGIIGGSGLDNPDILKDKFEKDVHTPYGKPASSLMCGKIGGIDVVILARHGRKHELYPTAVPHQANIWALKQEGAQRAASKSTIRSLCATSLLGSKERGLHRFAMSSCTALFITAALPSIMTSSHV